jgi:hypothetical protein
MAKALSPSTASGGRRRKPIEGTALLSLRPLSPGELQRVSRALAAEGISHLRAARIVLAPDDARAVGQGTVPIAATILPPQSAVPECGSEAALTEALSAARYRGAAVKDAFVADPEMLSTSDLAARLGMSEEGVRLKRKRREILGVESAKRGIRYPAWQITEDRQLLPALPQLFAVLGEDPWRLFRFLQQHHAELGGQRGYEALRGGRIEAVLSAAENTAAGAFA